MRSIARFGTLPVAVTVLTVITALYYVLVAFTNVTDYGTNEGFVDHVFAMDTTFDDEDVMWRRVDNNFFVTLAYLGIILWEGLTALVLILASVSWVRALLGYDRDGRTWAGDGWGDRYDLARRLSTLGWIMVIVLFAGGFITVGGEWFEMWQSTQFNGLAAALQNVIIAAVGLLLAHLPNQQGAEPS